MPFSDPEIDKTGADTVWCRMLTEHIAQKLDLDPRKLEKQSLHTYLAARMRHVEAEIFLLAEKYGVTTAQEFDALILPGKLHEREAFEDFFAFDHLQSERDKLRAAFAALS